MRQAEIHINNQPAGLLKQDDEGRFTFRYHDLWIADSNKPSISLTMPKTQQEYRSDFLFPFFYHMLPEGTNKKVVCHAFRIDPDDDFGLLLTAAKHDTVGAVTVHKISEPA